MSHVRKVLFLMLIYLSCDFTLMALQIQTLELGDLPSKLSIADSSLQPLHDQLVQVRGFWYPLSPEEGVLTSHPGLKSCCLASPTNIYQQIIVKGQISLLPPQKAVTMEGVFKINPLYDKDGNLTQYYILEQAREVPRTISYTGFLIVGILLTFLYLYFLRKKRTKLEEFIDK